EGGDPRGTAPTHSSAPAGGPWDALALPPPFLDKPRRLPGGAAVQAHRRHRRPLPRQRQRDGAADARTRARDHGHSVVWCHRCWIPSSLSYLTLASAPLLPYFDSALASSLATSASARTAASCPRGQSFGIAPLTLPLPQLGERRRGAGTRWPWRSRRGVGRRRPSASRIPDHARSPARRPPPRTSRRSR